jgi:hypothetical protein
MTSDDRSLANGDEPAANSVEQIAWLQAAIDVGRASPSDGRDAIEVLGEIMARNRAEYVEHALPTPAMEP